jgi:Zn-dependent protease
MPGLELIFAIAILIMSVVIHEISHGYIANYLGDPTARLQGRLSLNPISHLDPMGSIFIPLLTYLAGGFIIGWAKPVPFNPYNLSDQKWGPAYVALAGPLSNFLIALVFGLAIRFGAGEQIVAPFFSILGFIVFINILLAVFNLIPVPPLDGSRILFSVLPLRYAHIQHFLEIYGLVFIFLFIFIFWRFVLPFAFLLFKLIAGANF